MDNINHDYITEYIRQVTPDNNKLLQELEKFAQINNVPIVQPEAARLLYVITKIVNPVKVLEVGTAIGYSSMLISGAMANEGNIITIEKNEEMAALARENIKKAGLINKISVIQGDAVEILDNIEGHFDMIFLDAAKGQYMRFLPNCIKLLKSGGTLISDNILYKGMVASNDLLVRRKKTIVKRLRQYLLEINNNKQLETSIIPIGDGMSISIKK